MKRKDLSVMLFRYLNIFFFTVVLVACRENKTNEEVIVSKNSESKTVLAENKNAFAQSREADAQFLASVALLNYTEIKLARLAQEQTITKEIKDLGRMMETEHTNTLAELRELAGKKEISLPSKIDEKGQKEVDAIKDMKQEAFDKEYAALMVNSHKDAITLFEKNLKETKDLEINNWADKTLPALRKHLEHSETCLQNLATNTDINK